MLKHNNNINIVYLQHWNLLRVFQSFEFIWSKNSEPEKSEAAAFVGLHNGKNQTQFIRVSKRKPLSEPIFHKIQCTFIDGEPNVTERKLTRSKRATASRNIKNVIVPIIHLAFHYFSSLQSLAPDKKELSGWAANVTKGEKNAKVQLKWMGCISITLRLLVCHNK